MTLGYRSRLPLKPLKEGFSCSEYDLNQATEHHCSTTTQKSKSLSGTRVVAGWWFRLSSIAKLSPKQTSVLSTRGWPGSGAGLNQSLQVGSEIFLRSPSWHRRSLAKLVLDTSFFFSAWAPYYRMMSFTTRVVFSSPL